MPERSGSMDVMDGIGGNGVMLYHEVQESRLCAVHCVNAVLQGPYFSEIDLATMAQDLDQQEQQVMLESGASSSHYLKFMAEGSSNVAADGNFSIQVLNRALLVWDLQCIPLEAPEAEDARLGPQKQNAFICHLQAHWFTIRKVGDKWYNFNSLYPAPEHLSNFYLTAYLDTLKSSGWSIFVVQGSLPGSSNWGTEGGFGRWLTPEEADNITRFAKRAENEKSKAVAPRQKPENDKAKIEGANLAAALSAIMPAASRAPTDSIVDEDDPEYVAAIAASLANIDVPPAPIEHQQDRDKRLDAATLAQALAESFFSADSASGLTLAPNSNGEKGS